MRLPARQNPTETCILVVIIAQILGIVPSLVMVATTWRHSNAAQLSMHMQGKTPLTMVILRDGK